ncbi:MAG: hypothetical protein QOH90_1928 [Actinomycetota bacterium]|nr:hypothetical protein [Actinomycetota bacterium]
MVGVFLAIFAPRREVLDAGSSRWDKGVVPERESVTLVPEVLEGDGLRLVPLDLEVSDDMAALGDDPDALRFTYISAPFGREEARAWIQRYLDGWQEGSRAGFSVQTPEGGFLGMMSIIHLHLDEREGELGYIIAPHARGKGVATRALSLLTAWAFESLGLERAELRIASGNAGSVAVAERCGYSLEGTMRSLYFKNGIRGDTLIYSRLPTDPPPTP